MRRGLWLALGVTVAASAWVALSAPSSQPELVVAAAARGASVRSHSSIAKALPTRWDAPMLEAARRNPFGGDTPPPVVAAPAASPPPKLLVPQTPSPVAAPAPPVAQPFTYRYVGRVIDPQGQRVVYIGRGDVVVTVQTGTQLGDGHIVESLSESTIEFVNSTTQQRHMIPIPPDAAATAAIDSGAMK